MSFNKFDNSTTIGTLFLNSIAWASGISGTGVNIVTNNSSATTWLAGQGFTHVTQTSNWHTALSGANLLVVVLSTSVSTAQQQALADFVKNGGGLITGGTGWGYIQFGYDLRTLPGNVALRQAGLAWADGGRNATIDATHRSTSLGNVATGMQFAAQYVAGGSPTTAQQEEIQAAVSAMVTCLPTTDPAYLAITEPYHSRAAELNPTLSTPVSNRIHCNTGDISSHDSWTRMPIVMCVYTVTSTILQVASPFGGPIYIDVPQDAFAGTVAVTLAGAVEAPHFVLGQNPDAEWVSTLRQTAAPWAELESDGVVISLPSSYIRNLTDPTALMTYWRDVVQMEDELAGKPAPRLRPERFMIDAGNAGGVLWSGYPISAYPSYAPALVDYAGLLTTADWGFFHELGHNHQSSYWTTSALGEVSCNIFSMYVMDMTCNWHQSGWGWVFTGSGRIDRTEGWQAAGGDYDTGSYEERLVLFRQLADAFGWDAYQTFFRQYLTATSDQLPQNDQQERDQWLTRFSNIVGRNLGPFFTAWDFGISQNALNAVSTLPAWTALEADRDELRFIVEQGGTVTTTDLRANVFDMTNCPLSVAAVSTPQHGTLLNNVDGTVSYHAAAGYVGDDSFTYTVTNTQGGSITRTVKITVNGLGQSLDIDGNGTADALTDGILVLRYLFDPNGAWNYSDALGSGALRTTRQDIKSFLDGGRTTVLDVDGNGTPDALTDGILILRYLFDPNGAWNYSDALGSGATRTTRTQIKAFLDQYNPGVPPPSGSQTAAFVPQLDLRVEMASTINRGDPASLQTVASPSRTTVDVAESAGCAAVLVPVREDTIQNSTVVVGTSNDDQLIAGVAPAVLLGGDSEDVLFGRSTESADARVQDTVFQGWNSPSGYDIPLARLPASSNSSTLTEDSEALDRLYGAGNLDWFLRKPGDSDCLRRGNGKMPAVWE